MTQRDAILYSFRLAGGKMKLRDILTYSWGHEWNARKSDLRKEGFRVNYYKGPSPSENLYEIIPPEKSGQMRFA